MSLTTERTSGGDGPAFEAAPVVVQSTPDAPPPLTPPEDLLGDSGTDVLWLMLGAVWRRRWWILAATVLAAVGAVAFSLLMPNRYSAEARVLLPESGGSSSMSSLVESVAPGASALLGAGSGGDYTRYLAILTSRSVAERVVQLFGLIEEYETQDEPSPLAAAVTEFQKNTTFEISLEYNYLGIHTLDRDPRRAAAISNYLVTELNRENTRLSSETASERRTFIGKRLRTAEAALDSTRGLIQNFQERYGITDPGAQGQALMGSIGDASRAVAQADLYYQSLVSQYGDSGDNPDVNAARATLEAARGQLTALTSGDNSLMPVPLTKLPQVGRQYSQLEQEALIQAQIIEFVRPVYEQAAFDERRETSAVQVIDEAIVPSRKAEPRRSLIVIGVALSVFVLACALVVALALLRRNAPRIAERIRSASA